MIVGFPPRARGLYHAGSEPVKKIRPRYGVAVGVSFGVASGVAAVAVPGVGPFI
jgi:hypothetical protein